MQDLLEISSKKWSSIFMINKLIVIGLFIVTRDMSFRFGNCTVIYFFYSFIYCLPSSHFPLPISSLIPQSNNVIGTIYFIYLLIRLLRSYISF